MALSNIMRNWRYLVLLGVMVLGAVYLYMHREELGLEGLLGEAHSTAVSNASSSTGSAQAYSRPAHNHWQTVNRPGEGFKGERPADTHEGQVPAYNERGGADQVSMIFANPDGNTSYSLSWASDPPVARAAGKQPGQTLTAARDGALARTQTTLVSESRSAPGGIPALDFVGRNKDGGVIDVRLLYTGSRLYMLSASYPSASARREQDVTRFFNSFKSTNSAVPDSMPAAVTQ